MFTLFLLTSQISLFTGVLLLTNLCGLFIFDYSSIPVSTYKGMYLRWRRLFCLVNRRLNWSLPSRLRPGIAKDKTDRETEVLVGLFLDFNFFNEVIKKDYVFLDHGEPLGEPKWDCSRSFAELLPRFGKIIRNKNLSSTTRDTLEASLNYWYDCSIEFGTDNALVYLLIQYTTLTQCGHTKWHTTRTFTMLVPLLLQAVFPFKVEVSDKYHYALRRKNTFDVLTKKGFRKFLEMYSALCTDSMRKNFELLLRYYFLSKKIGEIDNYLEVLEDTSTISIIHRYGDSLDSPTLDLQKSLSDQDLEAEFPQKDLVNLPQLPTAYRNYLQLTARIV